MLSEKDRVLDTPIIRNIHARERETIMMGGFSRGSGEPEWYIKEQEKEQELSEQTGVNEQELSRLKTTTAQRVFWTVVGVALLLLLIVFIVGVNVFHW
jgi:hypothetical protein